MSSAIAIVTGGAQGIGNAIAQVLGARGYAVAIWDADRTAIGEATDRLVARGVRAVGIECDVADGQDVDRATEAVVAELGVPTALVNNAGTPGASVRLEDASFDQWQRVVDVNLTGVFLCTKAVGRYMLERHAGAIVNIASLSGVTPQSLRPAYSATKAAVIRFTEVVALEWGPRGIRCNCISPGQTRTRLSEAVYSVPELLDQRQRVVPLRRIGDPLEIARTAAFLLSDDASYVTGVNLRVDGGFSLTVTTSLPRLVDGKIVRVRDLDQ